jgi:hypothetical protein
MTNPLNSYINLARIVFSSEPAEPNEVWDEYEEFEEKLREFYENLLCKNCKQLLNDPCTPKKQHFSCHHRVCLDCIGKNRATTANCKMCRDFQLFEKSSQTKLVLRLYKELCELIKGSWIYDYVQRRTNHDTGQENLVNLSDMIEIGVNYGRSSSNTAMIQDDSPTMSSSSDENSNSSSVVKPIQNIIKKEKSPQVVPYTYHPQTFPTISPVPPCSPVPTTIVQSPDQFPIQEIMPIVESPQISKTPPIITVTTSPAPTILTPSPNITQISQIVQYSAPTIVQAPVPTVTTKPQIQPQPQLTVPNQQSSAPLLKTSQFISHVPMRVKPIAQQQAPTQINTTKSIMSPMKIQQTAPTIYSVMYTGSGNKITLKRKAPDDNATIPITSDLSASSNNVSMVCFLTKLYL